MKTVNSINTISKAAMQQPKQAAILFVCDRLGLDGKCISKTTRKK